jgi:hypothetical protein
MTTRGRAVTLLILGLLGLVVGSGCGGTSGPDESRHVSGRVQLVGYERDVMGTQMGVRVVSASGVPVFLLSGRAVADSTLSIDGEYVFEDVPPGEYAVSSGVVPGVSDTTAAFVVGDGSLSVEDTLRVRSSWGRPTTYPNPVSSQAIVAFSVDAADSVLLEVVDVSLLPVRVLLSGHQAAGLHEVIWDTADAEGQPVSPGPYWVILRQASGADADLVFVDERRER